ncbi:acyl-CoA dehydrogenase [Solibacillus sp. A46]|uniref:Acyl-CoA dehydrogenase n=1 Tax=Solibacillus faecavium TaxID=2762221 RepID=A0ABR8XTP0_9BACL|nr:acyl-CoA dehydrogenase family protein [Solibacillus faecavium]MBD8035307.1 acyl-CoA dehydrogenase [Solibacillus faecavium]
MSEIKDMVVEVVEKVLKDKVEKETVDLLEGNLWAENVWQLLLENELHNVAVSEEDGGAGGDIEDLLALYGLIGKYAAPVPFIEHTLANYLLKQIDIKGYEQLTTYSITTPLQLKEDTLFGTVKHVPWAKYAEKIVVLAQEGSQQFIVVADLKNVLLKNGTNLAAEPRSEAVFEKVKALQKVPITAQQYVALSKLVTAASVSKMNGALTTAFQLSVQFSKEREQFGRPIHRFQLVQQHLANMAGEQTLMTVATNNVQTLLVDGQEGVEVAYTRLRMDDASRVVTTAAHQVHAAIGVTHEHRLHQFTRRLWAWRDEEFTARYWKQQLAKQVLESKMDLWESMTEQNEAHVHA